MIRFKKPKNELEGQQKVAKTPRPSIPADMCSTLPLLPQDALQR